MASDLFETFQYFETEVTSFRICVNHVLDGLGVFGMSAMASTAVTCSYSAQVVASLSAVA